MSMESFALSDHQLNSVTEWGNATMYAEAFPFPVRLSAEVSFADLSGRTRVARTRPRRWFSCAEQYS